MSGDKRALLKQWLESGEARLHPITFPQRELWEAMDVPVSDPRNHICCLINVRGSVTASDCEKAIRRVVERHEVLRSSFVPGKAGVLQMIRRSAEPQFRFRELPEAQTSEAAIEELAGEIFRQPFDLLQGPLYRVEVLQRGVKDYVMVFAIHHALADGWSLGVFVQDLCGAYLQVIRSGDQPLPPVPLTYSAWGAAEREFWQLDQIDRCVRFWKTQLAGAPRMWPDTPLSASNSILRREVGHFSADLAKAARGIARSHGATLFSTLLAAFQVALSRWSGKEDIVVGTPVANRGKQTVRETMGYFAGNVPLRHRVDATQSFSDTLRAVHETSIESFAHAMPFAELARALGESSEDRHPIYQVRFALQNHPVPDVDLPSLSARLHMRSTGTARFDLGCEVTEMGDELEVVWLYRPELFSIERMAELKHLFQTVLTAASQSPASRVADLK